MKQSYKIEQLPEGKPGLAANRRFETKVSRVNSMSRGVTRVISFTSGKGGVGKTSLVVNVAIGLAREGKTVLILDADLGLANIDVMLGIRPRFTLEDVFEGRKTLEQIIVSGPEGISIIPSASGVESLCNLDSERRMLLMQSVENMSINFDYILIDTQAGIGPDVMYFNTASSEIICVINPEPTSLTDAYALIKVLALGYGEKQISVVANEVADEQEGRRTFARLQNAVERFLHVELNYLGHVPADESLPDAVRSQKALLEMFPSSPSGLAVARIARRMDTDFHELRVKGGMQFFFRQLLEAGTAGDAG